MKTLTVVISLKQSRNILSDLQHAIEGVHSKESSYSVFIWNTDIWEVDIELLISPVVKERSNMAIRNTNRLELSLTLEKAKNIVDTLSSIIQEVQIDNAESSLVLENPNIYEPNVVLVVKPDS